MPRPVASRVLLVFLADLISKHLGIYSAGIAIGSSHHIQSDHLAYSIYFQINNPFDNPRFIVSLVNIPPHSYVTF